MQTHSTCGNCGETFDQAVFFPSFGRLLKRHKASGPAVTRFVLASLLSSDEKW